MDEVEVWLADMHEKTAADLEKFKAIPSMNEILLGELNAAANKAAIKPRPLFDVAVDFDDVLEKMDQERHEKEARQKQQAQDIHALRECMERQAPLAPAPERQVPETGETDPTKAAIKWLCKEHLIKKHTEPEKPVLENNGIKYWMPPVSEWRMTTTVSKVMKALFKAIETGELSMQESVVPAFIQNYLKDKDGGDPARAIESALPRIAKTRKNPQNKN